MRTTIFATIVALLLVPAFTASAGTANSNTELCRQTVQNSGMVHVFTVIDGSTSMQHWRSYRSPDDESRIELLNLSMMEPPRWTRKVFTGCTDAVQFVQEQEIEGGGCVYIAFVDSHEQYELKNPEMRDLCPE
jgi:hypothetical protein